MKISAPLLVEAPVLEKNVAAVWCDLIKARLTFLVLLTTLVGFYVGSAGLVDYTLMLHSVLGTALLASGAAALRACHCPSMN